MARRAFNYISPSSMTTGHPMSGLKLSAENVCTVSAPWPGFLSDASKVASRGRGLSTAFLGETNIFSVDCSSAGELLLQDTMLQKYIFSINFHLLCNFATVIWFSFFHGHCRYIIFKLILLFPGTNLLLVGMHGPTRPCEQVSISYCGNSCYDISYVVKEKGSYILAVKWGEEHIPGSPFHVLVPWCCVRLWHWHFIDYYWI